MAHVSIMLFGPKTGKRNAFRQNIVNYHRLHNIPWIVVEGGFTRPPLVQQKYHGIGWKGIAGHGHHLVENAPSDRFEKLGLDVKPWKTDRSGPVLLCGQIPNDANIYYVDYSNWFRSTCNELKSLGVNYKVRFHPRLKGIKQKRLTIVARSTKSKVTRYSLRRCLDTVSAVIAYNSNRFSRCRYSWCSNIRNGRTLDRR